jgi:uncharacterized protein (TIGR02246 family)
MKFPLAVFIQTATRWLVASAAVLLVPGDAARGQQAVVTPAAKAATQPQGEATAAIRAAIRSYAEAFERGDGKTLAGLWTLDGDIIDDEGRVLNGREAVGQITAATKDAPRPAFRIEQTSLRLLTADASIAWATEPSKNFHGSMADVRLYRGLLTEQEIEKIMSETPMDKAK